ncbi:hypothetical protein ACFX15_024448 [Malus domestica]
MSDVYRMYRDAYFQDDGVVEPEHERIEPNFISLLEDVELPLFPGCTKYTNMRADREHLETCPTCDASRWKTNERNKKIHKGIPVKVLRYFPIIPRLRRKFRSPKKAKQLLWHSKHKSKDGKMRHPIDSSAWERIDRKYPNFTSDPRNLRFALSSDGFNPFDDLSSIYSVWPVVLVTYNLPPSLCMSKDNVILSLLIPGKEQLGNDIDVYFEPLIDDLKKLWNNGIEIRESEIPDAITRGDAWICGHTRKSGEFLNEEVATVANDALAKALGPERRGRVKGLGFGATPSQSPCVSTNHQGSGNLPNDSANHHANSANHHATCSKPQAKSSNLDAFSGNLNHNSPKP